jgi:hypothetical protein
MIYERARKAVIAAYVEPGSAWDVATYVNFHVIGNLNAGKLTGPAVERIWRAELKVNTPMRLLGEWPVRGFAPSDLLTVARKVLAPA